MNWRSLYSYRKAKVFPQWMEAVCTVIKREVGFIGWLPLGGLDEDGNIKAML